MKKSFTTLIALLIVSGCAQNKVRGPVPFQPGVTPTTHAKGSDSHLANHLEPRFKVMCPCCGQIMVDKPLQLLTNGGHSVDGGSIQSRSATFLCTNRRCQVIFTVPCEDIFVPTPTPAVEIQPGAPEAEPKAYIPSRLYTPKAHSALPIPPPPMPPLPQAAEDQGPPMPPGIPTLPAIKPRSANRAFRSADQPWLTIKQVDLGTNIQASVSSTSLPVTVRNATNIECTAEAQSGVISVVCGKALYVGLNALTNTTNELQWSNDMATWTSSNVRVVSDGTPFYCWLPDPGTAQFFRAVKR